MTPLIADLTAKILAVLPGAQVEIDDPNDDGRHLTATVVAEQFTGKSRVAQHKLVYSALGNAFERELHALQLVTRAPDQPLPETKETHPCL